MIFLINSLHKGGAERQVLTVAPALGASIYLLENEIQYDHIGYQDIQWLIKKKSNTKFEKIISFFQCAFKLRKLISKQAFPKEVVIVSFLERSNMVNLLVSFFTKHKAILSVRINLDIQYADAPLVRWFFKKFYKHAYKITSNSLGVCTAMHHQYHISKNKIIHTPNAYDIDAIAIKAHEKVTSIQLQTFLERNNYLLSVNRLDSQKNIDFQINLIALLKKQQVNISLIIIGDGPLKEVLKQQALLLNLSVFDHTVADTTDHIDYSAYSVLFMGNVRNPYPFYKNAKAFLLTSAYESLPNVLIEAMICGTIPIAADCKYGPREILTKEIDYNRSITYGLVDCGILLPEITDIGKEVLVWAQYINTILDDKINASQFSTASQAQINKYRIDNVLEKWKSVVI